MALLFWIFDPTWESNANYRSSCQQNLCIDNIWLIISGSSESLPPTFMDFRLRTTGVRKMYACNLETEAQEIGFRKYSAWIKNEQIFPRLPIVVGSFLDGSQWLLLPGIHAFVSVSPSSWVGTGPSGLPLRHRMQQVKEWHSGAQVIKTLASILSPSIISEWRRQPGCELPWGETHVAGNQPTANEELRPRSN